MGVPPPPHTSRSRCRRSCRVGSRSRSACPVGSCRSCAHCRRFDKSTYHFANSSWHFGNSSSHFCRRCSRFAGSPAVRLHRVFTDCLKLFSRKSENLACAVNNDLYPVPTICQHVKLWGGWVVSVQLLPVRIPDTLPAAVGQLLGCRCILLAYTVGK